MQKKFLAMEEIAALGDAIAETATMIDVATHRFLTQLREFDFVDGWQRAGALSCAHWLSWRVGMDLGAAREKVRVARRLAGLPLIDGALADGAISYAKVRAMTRIATPDNEADLLSMAKNTTGSQLERICRLKRSVNRLDASAAREQEECRRYVVQRSTDDGMVSTQVRLHPDEAARFLRALQRFGGGSLADGAVAVAEMALVMGAAQSAIVQPAPEAATPPATSTPPVDRSDAVPDSPPPVQARRPDAGAADAVATGTAASIAGRRTVRPPVEVVVHITAADLQGMTELGDGISAETCRRLLCDGGVVPMLEDEQGRTIDVGRKRRTIPVALRRALESRDGGCRFPGCTNRLFVDAHHIEHWIDGGATNLANTVLLCRRHHRYLHECGFGIEVCGDEILFRDPKGARVRPQADRPPVTADFATYMAGWLDDPITVPEPGWSGERVDYDLCIAALAERDAVAVT